MEPGYALAVCLGCFSLAADQPADRFERHRVNPGGCFRVDTSPNPDRWYPRPLPAKRVQEASLGR